MRTMQQRQTIQARADTPHEQVDATAHALVRLSSEGLRGRELRDALEPFKLRFDGHFGGRIEAALKGAGWTHAPATCAFSGHIRATFLASPLPADHKPDDVAHRVRVCIQTGGFLGSFTHLELSELRQHKGREYR